MVVAVRAVGDDYGLFCGWGFRPRSSSIGVTGVLMSLIFLAPSENPFL